MGPHNIVLEWLLPYLDFDLCTSMFQVYHESSEVRAHENRNAYRLPVSDEVLAMVRTNFSREIEFYEFCKQRLQKQFEGLKCNGKCSTKIAT